MAEPFKLKENADRDAIEAKFEKSFEGLGHMFAEAETLFDEKGREEAKPYLLAIYNLLNDLNTPGWKDMPIKMVWNQGGTLTEAQFDELTIRRKRLSNAVGLLNVKSGELRHDQNQV